MQSWMYLIFLLTFDIGGRLVALFIMGISRAKGSAKAKWLLLCVVVPFGWAAYLIFGANSYDIESTGKKLLKNKNSKD